MPDPRHPAEIEASKALAAAHVQILIERARESAPRWEWIEDTPPTQ